MPFKKKQKVVKVISGASTKTASLCEVESVKKGVVKLTTDEHLRYDDATGREIDPVIPGFNSEIITLE